MQRNRRQCTLRQLMIAVAVAGFEVFLYASIAKANVVMYKDDSTLSVIKGMIITHIAYGMLAGLIRSAFSNRNRPAKLGPDDGN